MLSQSQPKQWLDGFVNRNESDKKIEYNRFLKIISITPQWCTQVCRHWIVSCICVFPARRSLRSTVQRLCSPGNPGAPWHWANPPLPCWHQIRRQKMTWKTCSAASAYPPLLCTENKKHELTESSIESKQTLILNFEIPKIQLLATGPDWGMRALCCMLEDCWNELSWIEGPDGIVQNLSKQLRRTCSELVFFWY